MTKDKFIRFIKDNKHKFVFFNYRGGMGGETICNHLTRESDYFYNETLVKDIKDNKHHLFNGSTNWNDSNDLDNQGAIFSGYKDSNRNIFKDWMFGNMFFALKIAFKKIKEKNVDTKSRNRLLIYILIVGVTYCVIDTNFVSKIALMVVSFPIIWVYAKRGYKVVKK